ncbi:hypothetical protein INS49_007891 [Diaporthe citri]|uniref:uncharacterized protein n=1 Tax=Diaporthe citri TaxID=83186 RepID=UPI001C7FB6AF|nr:uncharacterized protein INS49_007891 [Diaporthe citri]KAG6362797.1 hypothetical protein INS49_007891 [Diaporthe citri]
MVRLGVILQPAPDPLPFRKPGDVNAEPAKKSFEVVAPEWALSTSADGGHAQGESNGDDDSNVILSVFPAPGETAPSFRTLPHIVLRDPQLPWARLASQKVPDNHANEIPWFALVVFTADELTLDEDHRTSYFNGLSINETLGWDIPVGKVSSVLDTSPEKKDRLANFIPLPNQRDVDAEVKTSLIAVPSGVFKKLFTNAKSENEFDISPYRFMTHVRNVAAAGTMSAAVANDDPNPKTNGTATFSMTGVPEGDGDEKVISDIVTRRQMDGYTLVRHRTVTGEQTTAMVRGPLTPTKVPHPLHKDVVFQSNFGTDLQILDPDLGLMDLSYASAWQLGKTLALADPSFTAALARLRTKIHEDALEAARKDIFKRLRTEEAALGTLGDDEHEHSVLTETDSRSTYVPKSRIKADVADLVGALNHINSDVHVSGTCFSTNRWNRRLLKQKDDGPDLFSLRSEHVFHQMGQHAQYITDDNANTPDGGPYNYHSVPNSTDYAMVQEWVLDKLHLAGIPAQYLLPDPSHLPPESLRLFHVDANWTDAMVDGALSLANHLADKPEEDFTRSSLKNTLNRYFKTPITGSYKQQIPTYGFILRSQLLVQFPDLAVSADFEKIHTQEDWANAKPAVPILVQRRLAADTMLVLFDRDPPELSKLTLTLPAHQQTFIAAFQFDETTDDVEMHYKRVYATGADEPLPVDQEHRREPLGVPMPECKFSRSRIFDWEARTLKIQEYADLVHDNLKKYMPDGQYQTQAPTSAVMALQLNEPIYTLVITAALPELPTGPGHSQKPPALTSEVEFGRWDLFRHEESEMFQFHPPAFPGEKYKPRSSLQGPEKAVLFQPTKLPVCRNEAQQRGDQDWVMIAGNADGKDGNEILPPPEIPMPLPDVAKPPLVFNVFPLGRPTSNVPTNSHVPLDLIFDIRAYPQLQYWALRVTHFDLNIPIAPYTDPPTTPLPDPDDDQTNRALLRSNAPEGPAPSMLYNIRFNVVRQRWDVKNGSLDVTVLPRTRWGVATQTFDEASFLLPLAAVFPWKVPRGKKYPFQVLVTAYMRDPHDPPDIPDTQYVYTVTKYMDCPGV